MTATQQKAAIVILSDPSSGSEEALGRVFNALASAYEFRSQGDEVSIIFAGAGTRWLGELVKPEHPAHALFLEVQGSIAGASCGCADAFGASEAVERSGFDFIRENPVPETTGLPSLRNLARDGYTVLTF